MDKIEQILSFLDSLVECCRKYEKPLQAGAVKPWIKSLGSRLEWVQKNRDAGTDEALKQLGNSCLAFECYPFTIFMLQKYWNAALEGLIETVNYGGDCDTTGAMYGALAGAKGGMFFPNAWRGIVKGLEPLEKAAEGILALRT